MALKEFLQNIPVVSDLIERHRVKAREQEIAEDLFHRWWELDEIDFSTLQCELSTHTKEEGLDRERIFIYLGRLCNPAGSL